MTILKKKILNANYFQFQPVLKNSCLFHVDKTTPISGGKTLGQVADPRPIKDYCAFLENKTVASSLFRIHF